MKITKLSDEWCTPQWLFDELNKEFNFDVDLCSTIENKKCELRCDDYLDRRFPNPDHYTDKHTLAGKTCFMNPPYSNPKPFIEQTWDDARFCKIVCLVKCDPSTRWWAIFWNYGITYDIQNSYQRCVKYSGHKPGCGVRFFPKRIKFEHQQMSGKSGPTFPCVLIIMDRRDA